MWILDTDTDLLGGRRVWVRPGSESILGRTQFAGATQKAISRRHIVLKVDEVPKDEGLSIRYHSKLTLKDESKKGSTIDGEFINGTSVVLDPTIDHEFQMATAPQIFRLKYEPQIFTIHSSSKKKSTNPKILLKDYLSKLEQLDIKCIPEFLPGKTTVAVVTKRNLPISLRALVNGAWIVTSAFVDAIATVATQVRGDDGDLLDSPLQLDIATNWPDPLGFLPPPGQEPNPKAPEYFRPNPKRKTMFEKWVVVCCTQQHMDVFTGVVTDGGGKTDLFELREGKTKPAELIVHIDRLGRKVIVLHPNVEGDWYIRFRREVEERTGVRFAEQNEFLDAVLLADAKELAKPYEAEESSVVVHESVELPAPPPSTEVPKESQPVGRRTRAHDHDEEVAKPEPSQMPPPTRASTTSSLRTQTRTSRYISQIKIDSDDEDFVPLPPPSSSTVGKLSGASQSMKSASGAAASSTSRAVSQATGKSTQLSAISETQQQQSLQTQGMKRRSIPSDDDDEDDEAIMDRMLTGQATMKRRKIEEEAKQAEAVKPTKILPSAQKKAEEPPTPPEPEPIKLEDEEMEIKPTKGKKKAVDSKVIQTAQEIRRKEEAKAAEEDAANEMSPEEIAAVARMRDLAIVEVFDIVARTDKPTRRSQAYGDEGDRWDNTWNGRRNFKKFKKRSKNGEVEGPMRRMGGHIMVPLVEHRVKDFGTGEGYWVESEQSSVAAGKRRENQGVNISHISETQVGGASVGKGKGVMEVVVDVSDDDEFFEEETARDESLLTKKSQGKSQRSQGTQQASGKAVRGSVRGGTQASTTAAKRATSNRNSISEEPAKKKAKTMAIFNNDESEEEDSDDDELKFKFR